MSGTRMRGLRLQLDDEDQLLVSNGSTGEQIPVSGQYGLSPHNCSCQNMSKIGLVLYPTNTNYKNIVLLVCGPCYKYKAEHDTQHQQLADWYFGIYGDQKSFRFISGFSLKIDGELGFNCSTFNASDTCPYQTDDRRMGELEQNVIRKVVEEKLDSYTVGSNNNRNIGMATARICEKKIALLIGNNTYVTREPLQCCINDANDLSDKLRSIGFTITVVTDADYAKMRRTIDDFVDCISKGNLVVFFFAGHGTQWNDQNYLLPIDSDRIKTKEHLKTRAINAQDTLELMLNNKPIATIFLLDCCRDYCVKNEALLDSQTRGNSTSPTGLASMDALEDSLIAFACAPGKMAQDVAKNGHNGLFTFHLLQHITKPNADIEILMRDVCKGVTSESDGKQKPHRVSSIQSPHLSLNTVNTNTEFQASSVNDGLPISCLKTLQQTKEISDQFIDRLTLLCTDKKQPLLPQLKIFFPEKQYIDYEFSRLKPLLKNHVAMHLEILLEYWKNREHINHVCKGCKIMSVHYKIPASIKSLILQNILGIDDETTGETFIAVYQDYYNHYLNRYSSLTLELISQWSLSNELLIFLHSLEATDIDDLLEIVNDWDEIVNDWDETVINTKILPDLLVLKKFFDKTNIKTESVDAEAQESFELDNIIYHLEEVLKDIEFKNIISSIESCSKNLSSIQSILMESKTKKQLERKHISDIMKNSSFSFFVSQLKGTVNTSKYQFDVNMTSDNWEPISFDDLSDLRDRARPMQYASSNSNNLQNYIDDHNTALRSFISLVDTIEVILQSSTSLYETGYPIVKQFHTSPKILTCDKGDYKELDNFKLSVEIQLSDWEKQLCTMYKQYINLTYFSHQQISMVDEAIRRETITKPDDPTYHLLKFIGIKPELIQTNLLSEKTDTPYDLLKTVATVIKTERDISKFSIQEDSPKNKKIFLVETTNKGILRAIYSLFHLNNTPIVGNKLFYCREKTNWIEVRAFIYRCFYSQTLHQFIRPELLSIVIQDQFAQLLYQLIEQSPNHLFRLGIITIVPTTQLYLANNVNIHHIRIIHDQEMLNETDLEDRIRKSINNNCKLVTSRIAGLGKSTFTQNEVSRLGKKCVKFPISGDVDIDILMEQLRDKKIQSTSSSIAIHIDIGPVANVQQLNEFLYCLILFRSFQLGQMPVYIQTDIPIYIELDSSSYLSNLKDELVILQYLGTKYIYRMDWNELESNSPDIQLTTNYLQAVEDETINKKDINEDTINNIGKSTCIHLLKKYFFAKKNPEFISWTQLSIFISVFYKVFSAFSKCSFFMVDFVGQSSSRLDIIKSLLDSCEQFTSLSVEKVRRNERSIHSNEPSIPFSEAITQWKNSHPFTLILTDTDIPLFVYKEAKDIPSSLIDAYRLCYQTINSVINMKQTITSVPQRSLFSRFWPSKTPSVSKTAEQITSSAQDAEKQVQELLIDPKKMTHEQFFLRLTSLSTKYFTQKSICETCLTQYAYSEQQCAKCLTTNTLIRSLSTSNQDIEDFQKRIANKLQSQYVFTADNYIKMLLIYLRVHSNLPVLIMGETGCGKTALIQCLCQKILDDEMEVFHIHAGVTNDKIIETMHDLIKKAQKCSEKYPKKRLWVFFDGFNTTSNIGLLKEIICERTLLGAPLPENMVFLGACNPQRRNMKIEELDDEIGIKKYHLDAQRLTNGVISSLLYSVVPIPETMLEHISDYGYLDEATEMSYIKRILNKCEQLTTVQTWFDCVANSISASQKYFREREDVSSVSLRDVARFCRFYNWFYNFPAPTKTTKVVINQIERASLLALFLCYYFRLDSSTKRKDYMTTIESSIKKYKPNISFDFLNELLNNEKIALVQRMELPPGTAINRALTDNIFVLFTCIVNQLPVILCGKPGSSKTSAVQIIISNLRGRESEHPFLRTLPRLIAISYQGSHNCTSESIIKVFAQADKIAQAKTDAKLLPVIVFDEIGLAEVSPHNPLKVLHSELEIETCRYGFVGLSNWRLDASTMNRAIYITSPDLDLEDLKMTASSLSKSMLSDNIQAIPLDNSVIEGLAFVYAQMIEHMKLHRNQHYFGLRDYYSLMKGIMYDMLHKPGEEQDLYKIIRHHLSLNFDGISDGSKSIWSTFCKRMHQHQKVAQYSSPTFDQLIHQSLSSRNDRFLMLIGENENEFDYVQRYINIKHPFIQTRTLIGSTLAGDFLANTTYSEQYNTRVLMDVIFYAEQKITLFLRGLGHLYDNLYDLFKQNFAVFGKEKFCRIALGSHYRPRCMIHDKFYCVVFVKKQHLDRYGPSFLNPFQKHLIDVDSLIDERYRTIMSTLTRRFNQVLATKTNQNVNRSPYLSIWFNDNYILNLVNDAFDQMPLSDTYDNNQDVLEYCQQQILRICSFDFPLLLSLESGNDRDHLIKQYYKMHNDLSFSSFINQILQQQNTPKLLIYTYTQIYHIINYSDINNHEKSIEEVKISHFKTELELIQKIKAHYQSGSYRLLCIRVDYHEDHQHIPMLKHLLLNEQVVDKSRGVCLIFHLQRNKLHQSDNDVFFNGWTSVMIDDLQTHQLISKNILINPSYSDLVNYTNFLSLAATFDELIKQCMMKFRYTLTDKNREGEINGRRDRIIQQLTLPTEDTHESLRTRIKNYLLEMIENIISDPNQTQFKDWRQDLLTNEIVIGSCRSFNDAFTKTVFFVLEKYLLLLLAHLEKHSMFDSYLFLIHSDKKIHDQLRSIWSDCWTNTVKNIDMSIMNQTYTDIPLVFDLHLPYATMEYEIIRQIRHTIAQHRQNDYNDGNWIDFAYKQLLNTSVYGQFINTILTDSDLFDHYYHDQLTLARHEANIYYLSTSFIQGLLTSKICGSVKDRLSYLLIDSEELFELMRVFEIGILSIGEEDMVLEYFTQQLIDGSDIEEKSVEDNNKFYRIILKESDFHLISPGTSIMEENIFECYGNPFIEVSLMNLFELLISPTNVDRMNNIEQMITTYGLVIQTMLKISNYDHYEISNLEKIHSSLRLASCLSTLFSSDKALDIFKQIYRYSSFSISFNTLDDMRNFIIYLKKVIQQHQSTATKTTIERTLVKFESELLINWSIGNFDQYGDILKFINDQDLWKYSAKIFTFIDTRLELSSTIMENSGQMSENDEYECINLYLSKLEDPTHKIEILMNMRIYMQLILDENCQPQMNGNYKQLTRVLIEEFDNFQGNLNEIEHAQNEQRVERISLIAWCKYYLLHYIYAVKHDMKANIMDEIDKMLARNDSRFCSTVKLYIIKQLCYVENLTFHELCSQYTNRNITWIRSMTVQPYDQRTLNSRRNFILPTPLFEVHEEFKRIDQEINPHITSDRLKHLIKECATKQDKAYCFLLWFIHYYTRFYMKNISPNDQFVKLIKYDVSKELITCFEPVGYKLIYSLCTNFNEKSYFRLKYSMHHQDLHQRLLVLNIIALLISFKSAKIASSLGFLLFEANLKMPQNYTEHFKKFDSLTGVALANDPTLIQMINIRTRIHNQVQSKINVFRCSSNCSWLFYFINCDIPDEQKQCPLCKTQISVSRNKDLLIINKPYIEMNINETLQFISQYIEEQKKNNCVVIVEKPDHLNQPLTYHFMNFFTHAIFLFLNELNFIPHSTPVIGTYFQESIASNYLSIRQHLSNIDQCYIWLYKLINHMMNEDFVIKGYLNSPEKVIQLEKIIEDKLIIPHIDSVINEIREYKSLYADFVYGNDKQNTFANFVDELVEDNGKYPLLHFFNVTNIHSINIIEDFHSKLKLQSDYEKTYPLTTFLLERLSDYDNIQYLYPIIRFTNYLMQKFNHHISRNDAMKKTISHYFNNDSDFEANYKQFLDVWCKINLNEIYLDQTKLQYESSQHHEKFDDDTKISMFLLNKSKDNENMILLACLQTFANLQNQIVDYFHSHVMNYEDKDEEHHHRIIRIQSLQQKHLFYFDTNKMRKLLVERRLMINYKYGMSQEIIYDYDEIEWILRNGISCLPWIDIKNMQYFNYQFELYDENVSLINDIRERFEQKLFDNRKRSEMERFMNILDNESILQISGSLEYILGYLRTITNKNIIKKENTNVNEIITIQAFIDANIHSKICISDKFRRQPFASISLEYIIDLYELIEEVIFDRNLCDYIGNELCEKSVPNEQRISIVNQFINMIFDDKNLPDCLKDLNCWINMFKRLLVRLLSPKIDIKFDLPLEDFVKRLDTWKGNITKDDIQTITIKRNIQLKHIFIIFKGLEAKREERNLENRNELPQRTNVTAPPSSSARRRIRPIKKTHLQD